LNRKRAIYGPLAILNSLLARQGLQSRCVLNEWKQVFVRFYKKMAIESAAAVFNGHLMLLDVDTKVAPVKVNAARPGDKRVTPSVRVCGDPVIDSCTDWVTWR
jgi:hypothetical protein